MSTLAKEVAQEYKTSLADLVDNAKPRINFLTIVADENHEHASAVVDVLIEHTYEVQVKCKLPCLYLIDSIMKNTESASVYIKLFHPKIHSLFAHIFEKSDEKIRRKLYTLRQTWNNHLRRSTLYQLDIKVNAIDPGWPITAPTTSAAAPINPSVGEAPNSSAVQPNTSKKVFVNPEFVKQKASMTLLQSEEDSRELKRIEEQKRQLEQAEQEILAKAKLKSMARTEQPPEVKMPKEALSKNLISKPTSRGDLLKPYIRKKVGAQPPKGEQPAPASEKQSHPKAPATSNTSHSSQSKALTTSKTSKTQIESGKASISEKATKSTTPTKSKSYNQNIKKVSPKDDELKSRSSLNVNNNPRSKQSQSVKTGNKYDLDKLFEPDPVFKSSGKKSSKYQKSTTATKPVTTSAKPTAAKSVTNSTKPVSSSSKPVSSSTKPVSSSSTKPVSSTKSSPTSTKPVSTYSKTSVTASSAKAVAMSTSSKPAASATKPVSTVASTKPAATTPSLSRDPRMKNRGHTKVNDQKPTSEPFGEKEQRNLAQEKRLKEVVSEVQKTERLISKKRQRSLPSLPQENVRTNENDSCDGNKRQSLGNSSTNEKAPNSTPAPLSKLESKSSKPKDTDFRLFGSKDIDLRVLPGSKSGIILPPAFQELPVSSGIIKKDSSIPTSVPEKPIIPSSGKDNPNAGSWKTFREQNPEFSEYQKHITSSPFNSVEKSANTNNKSLIRRKILDDDMMDVEKTPVEMGRQKDCLKEIVKQAEDDWQIGNISFSEYNNTLQKVANIHHKNTEMENLPENFPGGNYPLPTPHSHRGRYGYHPYGMQDRAAEASYRAPKDAEPCQDSNLPPVPERDVRLVRRESETRSIAIDGKQREIRVYGLTAVLLMDQFEPRTVFFQSAKCNISFENGAFGFRMHTNEDYREFKFNGEAHRVCIGVPTQELYIDGRGYQCFFGGKPVSMFLSERLCTVSLVGKPPNVSVGKQKNQEYLLGKVYLTINDNGEHKIPLFLDAKPQIVILEKKPHIFKFLNNFKSVKINDIIFPVSFGGVPIKVSVLNKKKFLFFSNLPSDIIPGISTVKGMDQDVLMPNYPDNRRSLPPPRSSRPSSRPQPPANTSSPPPGLADEAVKSSRPGTYNTNEGDKTTHTAAAPPPPVVPPIDLNSLYESLVKVGIIGDKSKLADSTKRPQLEEKGKKVVPLSENDEDWVEGVDGKDPPAKNRVYSRAKMDSLFQSKELRRASSTLVAGLFRGIQCANCGLRFSSEQTEQYSTHLDWHFRQNKKDLDKNKVYNRKFYLSVDDWVEYEEVEDVDERVPSIFENAEAGNNDQTDEKEESVPVSSNEPKLGVCPVCMDTFSQFFQDESDEWHYRNAVLREGLNYHPICYQDLLQQQNKKEEDKTPINVAGEKSVEAGSGIGEMEVSENKAEEKESQNKNQKEKINLEQVEKKKTSSNEVQEKKSSSNEVQENKSSSNEVQEKKTSSNEVQEKKSGSNEVQEKKSSSNEVEKDKSDSKEVEMELTSKDIEKSISNKVEPDGIVDDGKIEATKDDESKKEIKTKKDVDLQAVDEPKEITKSEDKIGVSKEEEPKTEKKEEKHSKEQQLQMDNKIENDTKKDNGKKLEKAESCVENKEGSTSEKTMESKKEADVDTTTAEDQKDGASEAPLKTNSAVSAKRPQESDESLEEPPKKKSKKKKKDKTAVAPEPLVQVKTEPVEPQEVEETYCTAQLPTPGVWPSIKEEVDDIEETPLSDEGIQEMEVTLGEGHDEEEMMLDTVGDQGPVMVASMDGNMDQREAPDSLPAANSAPRIRINLKQPENKNSKPVENGEAAVQEDEGVDDAVLVVEDDDDIIEWDEFIPPPFAPNLERHPSFDGQQTNYVGITRNGIESSGMCSIM